MHGEELVLITLMRDDEEVLVVHGLTTKLLAHQPLAVQDLVQLYMLMANKAVNEGQVVWAYSIN